MRPDVVRLIANLDQALRSFNAEQLFYIAQALAAELERRGEAAHLEARALQCALLPAAQELHALRRAAEQSSEP